MWAGPRSARTYLVPTARSRTVRPSASSPCHDDPDPRERILRTFLDLGRSRPEAP